MLLPAVGNAWAADPPEHLWSRAFTATPIDTTGGYIEIRGIALNSAGHAAIVGKFHGSVDLGGGPLLSSQHDDVFVARFDASGGHVWSRAIAKGNIPRPSVVAIDAAGNLVVGGQFIGTLNLGGTPLISNNFADAYLAKFGPDGAHLWSKRFGLSGSGAFGNLVEDIVVGIDGSMVVVGSFTGRVDFGGGVLQTAGGHDIFLAKLGADGGHIWSRRFGGPSLQQGSLVAMDAADNVTIAGRFHETLDLGGGPFMAEGEDGFMARFDSLASHVWSRWIVTSPAAIFNSINVNEAGDIVLTGIFSSSIDFGGTLLTGSGSFMTCFDAIGSYRWHVHESPLQIVDSAFDELGYVLVAGSFEGTLDLGGGPIESVERDALIARFDSNGELDWTRALGGSGDDSAGRLAVGPTADGLLLSGYCWEGIDFDGGGLEGNVSFLAQLAQRPPEPTLVVSLFPQSSAIEVRWSVTSEQPLDTLTILRAESPAPLQPIFSAPYGSGSGSFVDHDVAGGRKYEYQLAVTTPQGLAFRSSVVTVTATVPMLMNALAQNAPNPFNPTTSIAYSLNSRAEVSISVYDATGVRVRRIELGVRDAGEYSVEWNGRDDAGTVVGTGVYFYRLDGVTGVAPRKMVLLK